MVEKITMDDVKKFKMSVNCTDLINMIGELLGRIETLEEKIEKMKPSGILIED